jgi:cysteine desulfurase / selenocysteine lyase
MTTSDPLTYDGAASGPKPLGAAPPQELRGPLSQATGGGSLGPLRAAEPVSAVSGGPGLALGAAAPPGGPTLPEADPVAMATVLARMAGELFTGSSVSPVPLAPAGLATGGAGGATPVSPGIAPVLAPGGPSEAPAPSPGVLSASAPAAAPLAPIAAGPVAPVPATPPSSSGALQPFGVPPSFDIPSFEAASLGASPLGDMSRLPAVDVMNRDAPPYFVPDANALGIETDLDEPSVAAYEVAPEPASLVRDLGGTPFDPYAVRRDFPILEERVHGRRLVWLDNAATTQKPNAVIRRLTCFYKHENSNVHRGAHALAARATDAYEGARDTVRRFLNAPSARDIIFVRGATEGINLVAKSWGAKNVGPGDEIVITWLEHHANIVPWQQLCAETGARLRVAPVDDRGDVLLDAYDRLLGPRTKLVAFPQVSNALGTVTPAREMVEMAHRHGARVLVDGAQAVSHMRVDVQDLDCDFYVFSGHKVFAPTGIGAVFGKRDVLESMPPWQGGGNMIQDVTFERTVYQPPPMRFEAGTGNIADAAGLGEALDYLTRLGLENVSRYEHDLLVYATDRLLTVPGLHMIGTSPNKAGVLSFVLDGQRTEDVGAALDKEGIAVRSGHHCAQPILRRFGLESTVRASLAPYNVCEDIDALVDALMRLQGVVGLIG